MYATETIIRVRYAETDKMGYCYYGNYAQYFEVARVEALRNLGISYKSIEESGVILPVIKYNIEYKKPAYYDDEITVRCIVDKMPNVKIVFNYQTFKGSLLLNEAQTTLVFVDQNTNKPIQAPKYILDKFKTYF